MCWETDRSRHFIITDVRAIDLESFKVSMAGFLGIGIIVQSLVKIPASWSVHALTTVLGMPSGPAAFLLSGTSSPHAPEEREVECWSQGEAVTSCV